MNDLNIIEKIVKEKESLLLDASRSIWSFAELPYEEYKSSQVLIDILKNEGFSIEKGVADIPTAFVGEFEVGFGGRIIGFLGEYDALDTLNQEAGNPIKTPIIQGAPGHGCGHNLLGVGSLGAAIALKNYLINEKANGTVVYYGCPGEEGAGSKQFMARAGIFNKADIILTWHPSTKNSVDYDPSNAIIGANFHFEGVSSHAGSSPHLGRSALDAAELMSVGSNYLREHTVDKARIHYAYVDAGGTAPNVVQDSSLVKYEVRSPKVFQAKELFERVVNVARGAALMTDTKMKYEITMAFSDYSPNAALTEIAENAFVEIGAPDWNREDYALAKAFLESYDKKTFKVIEDHVKEFYGEDRVWEIMEKPLDSEIHSYDTEKVEVGGGSTDVGDVTYVVPTVNFLVATSCIGNVGHTWQSTGQSGSRIGEKGMLVAAKVMALSAIRIMNDRKAIDKGKELVLKRNNGKYNCPLPDDISPPIGKY